MCAADFVRPCLISFVVVIARIKGHGLTITSAIRHSRSLWNISVILDFSGVVVWTKTQCKSL
jgi:hypothetical protein